MGVAFSNTITASGSPTNFTVLSGTVPAGLTFNSNNGTITGTPTAAGTNNLSVNASDTNGASAPATITLTIAKGAQTIAFGALPVKVVGEAPFPVSATAGSGLSVAFSSSRTNVASVLGNIVTLVGPGVANIVASQSGDGHWNAATNVTNALSVVPANVIYWNFETDTPAVVPSGWSAGLLSRTNHNGTNALLGTTSASSGYTNTLGVMASGGNNAGAAAKGGTLSTDSTNGSTYFEFSVTAPGGSTNPAVTSLSFASRSTSSGSSEFAIRTSADGFANNLASGSLPTDTSWSVQNLSTPVWLSSGATTTFRIYGYNPATNVSSSTINWRVDDLTLVVGELAPTTPTLTPSPSSLLGLESFNGSPSVATNYILTGSNLTEDVVVSASASLEISSDGNTYTNQLVLVPSSGTVSNSIRVRIGSSASIGALTNAAVTHASTGITNQVVVSGTVYDATRGKSSNSLVGWDTSSQTGFGISPLAPVVQASNLVITAGLTRGTGLTTSGGISRGGWGANGWAADLATGIASNDYVSFTLAAANGHKLSISSISKFDYRRNTNGPTNGMLQVQVGNSGSYENLGELVFSSSSDSGASLPVINLSTNANLQNIPADTAVTFRIVNYPPATSSGTWYIFDKSGNPNVDFELTGVVEPVASGTAPTITSTNAFSGTVGVAFSNTVTATGDAPIAFSGTGLPGGLSVAAGGAITGMPTAAGTFNATLTAINAAGTNNQAVSFIIASATPADSSFSGWLEGATPSAELLLQYAYGAVSVSNAVNRSNLPAGGVIGSNLTLTYYVRKNATNVNLVTPQVHTNLVESTTWTAVDSNNITPLGTNTVDGVEVIQRRVSVPVEGSRKFLRLIIAE